MLYEQLREALFSLYDPSVLINSPLNVLFGLNRPGYRAAQLRDALIQAIETMQPRNGTPQGTRSWRVNQILRRRFIEQIPQRQVALDMGLSLRQLQREEKIALQILDDYLVARYGLWTESVADADLPSTDPSDSSVSDELSYNKRTLPAYPVDLSSLVAEVVATISPLAESQNVSITPRLPEDLPIILLQETMLRQALLGLFSALLGFIANGAIQVTVERQDGHLCIIIRGEVYASDSGARAFADDSMAIFRQLIEMCDGSMNIDSGPRATTIRVTFAVTEPITVVGIDDNADSLTLYTRYLQGTRYRFLGESEVSRGLELAQSISPHFVLLDLMYQHHDGWAVLGQIREHPKTSATKLIVCSILPMSQLAFFLGAAGFLKKPISRRTLLEELDRQLDSLPASPI